MIYGIGIDLVNIGRMQAVLRRWGKRFTGRVFTSAEIETCSKRPHPASSYALYFAAKEAFSKALGLGMRKGVRWSDIEVFHLKGGKPELRVKGRSSEICQEKNIKRFHLSLSDEGQFGVAVVVLEKNIEVG